MAGMVVVKLGSRGGTYLSLAMSCADCLGLPGCGCDASPSDACGSARTATRAAIHLAIVDRRSLAGQSGAGHTYDSNRRGM